MLRRVQQNETRNFRRLAPPSVAMIPIKVIVMGGRWIPARQSGRGGNFPLANGVPKRYDSPYSKLPEKKHRREA
jgi:hypothetical protein